MLLALYLTSWRDGVWRPRSGSSLQISDQMLSRHLGGGGGSGGRAVTLVQGHDSCGMMQRAQQQGALLSNLRLLLQHFGLVVLVVPNDYNY